MTATTIPDRRKPWQKLRWWSAAIFLVLFLLQVLFPGLLDHVGGGCIEHSRWEFC